MFPTWYRFQITSTLSILHRLTGIALACRPRPCWPGGSSQWPPAARCFVATHAFIASPIGMLLLFGWSIAFSTTYAAASGISPGMRLRLRVRDAYRSGYAVIATTAVLTVANWLYVVLA